MNIFYFYVYYFNVKCVWMYKTMYVRVHNIMLLHTYRQHVHICTNTVEMHVYLESGKFSLNSELTIYVFSCVLSIVTDVVGSISTWHWWFSGRILACHVRDLGSILSQCITFLFVFLSYQQIPMHIRTCVAYCVPVHNGIMATLSPICIQVRAVRHAHMYHFNTSDQRKVQGYKSHVSLCIGATSRCCPLHQGNIMMLLVMGDISILYQYNIK